jgi:hypothetical protein
LGRFLRSLLPPLQIHCWGGLGSQLFAWALNEDYSSRFLGRRIILILHNSGVTKRESELDFLFPAQFIRHVSDFDPDENSLINRSEVLKSGRNLRKILRSLFIKLGVLAECDSDDQFKSLKVWVIQIRGHYSYRSISNETVSLMNDRALSRGIKLVSIENSTLDKIGIHYRLGDLVDLHSKNPIDSRRIIDIVRNLESFYDIHEIEIYSDTVSEALKRISTGSTIIGNSVDPWVTLHSLQSHLVFVATISKISFWIVRLRLYGNTNAKNAIPNEMEYQMKSMVPEFELFTGTKYF